MLNLSQKLFVFVTKTNQLSIRMDSLIQKVEKRITSWKRGRVFFGNDFADLGTSDAVRQALGRLAKEGRI